jgi:hypothetical protein
MVRQWANAHNRSNIPRPFERVSTRLRMVLFCFRKVERN